MGRGDGILKFHMYNIFLSLTLTYLYHPIIVSDLNKMPSQHLDKKILKSKNINTFLKQ